jgi:hypothetical protein
MLAYSLVLVCMQMQVYEIHIMPRRCVFIASGGKGRTLCLFSYESSFSSHMLYVCPILNGFRVRMFKLKKNNFVLKKFRNF